MPPPTVATARIPLLGTLRCAVVGLALAELVYLLAWVGLVAAAAGGLPVSVSILDSHPLDSVESLGAGMVWAALFGSVSGLVTAATHDLVLSKPDEKADRGPASSHVVRNQRR